MLRNTLRATALIVLVAAFGCSDDSTAPPPNGNSSAPNLLASTMTLDLDFPGAATTVVTASDIVDGKPGPEILSASASRENWINAYVRAIYAVLITYDNLEEPIAAFAYAIHSVPQAQEDGSYLWTYIFVDQETGVEYQVYLYGLPGVEVIDWRMEVSSNNPEQLLDRFVWFSGQTARDERSGYWQFYEPVDATNGVESVRIDWQRQPGDQRLTITSNAVGSENEGDYLDFHDTLLQSSIVYYDASDDLTSNITWYVDGSGSLTVPDYNGGARACWDQDQRDVACPAAR